MAESVPTPRKEERVSALSVTLTCPYKLFIPEYLMFQVS